MFISKFTTACCTFVQGIGDSSQGFANAIIFVIFTKNIRDSFIKCICCGKRGKNGDDNIDANCEGEDQEHSRGSSQLAVPSLREAELSESEKVSLVFGSFRSNKNHKLEHSGQYGAIN